MENLKTSLQLASTRNSSMEASSGMTVRATSSAISSPEAEKVIRAEADEAVERHKAGSTAVNF
jgi:hypothetical protein